MPRKRAYIPRDELLAAALVCLLPQEQRDTLRRARLPTKKVLRKWTFDHLDFHALGGSDKWWNLDPVLRGQELKLKDAFDRSKIAKVRRNQAKWEGFMRALAAGKKPPRRKAKKPPQRMPKWAQAQARKWL